MNLNCCFLLMNHSLLGLEDVNVDVIVAYSGHEHGMDRRMWRV